MNTAQPTITAPSGCGRAAGRRVRPHRDTAGRAARRGARRVGPRGAPRHLLDTGRYRMPYFVWGSGPPSCSSTGWPTRARAFIPVMAALRREFTCVAYELPGRRGRTAPASGLSPPPPRRRPGRPARPPRPPASPPVRLVVRLDDRPRRRMHARPGCTRAILQGGFAYRPLRTVGADPVPVRPLLAGTARDAATACAAAPPVDMRVFRRRPEEFQFHRENSGGLPKAAVARRGLMILDVDLRPRLPAIRQPVLDDLRRLRPRSCRRRASGRCWKGCRTSPASNCRRAAITRSTLTPRWWRRWCGNSWRRPSAV